MPLCNGDVWAETTQQEKGRYSTPTEIPEDTVYFNIQ